MKIPIHRLALLALILLAVVGGLVLMGHPRRSGVLTVSFLDIGQGDAVYIESPDGTQMLYDAGPNAKILSELRSVMPLFDRMLDLAMLSHPDQDHVAGFADVLRRYSLQALVDDGYQGEVKNQFYDDILTTAKGKGIPVLQAHTGEAIDLGGGVHADILAPDGEYSVGDTNIASIVLKLSYGSTSVLLSGDLPTEFEDRLVERYGNAKGGMLDVDVFKAGHHGSKTANGERLLQAMTPELVVISSGAGNKYGHPNKEVTDRFDALHIPWMNTATKGRVTLVSDGQTWKVATQK